MSNKEDLLKISEKLEAIIYNEVVKREVKSSKDTEKYQFLLAEVNSLLDEARALEEDVKKQGLTVSSIEAEGFLRGVLTVKGFIEYIEESY